MPAKIVAVDDDPMVLDLTVFLLQKAGFEVTTVSDSRKVLETIREVRPDLVLLDMLMPGFDGFSLCRSIKQDPELGCTKVAMVSGKAFGPDRRKALDMGAIAFILKPYQVDTFVSEIQEILDSPSDAAPAAPAAQAAAQTPLQAALKLVVWGCRGPLAPSEPSRFGNRTACVSLEFADHLFVFDAGSGLRALGERLLAEGRPRKIHLFLSHFHRDHVEGLAGFGPLTRPGYSLLISGAADPAKPLQDEVSAALAEAPPADGLQAEIELYELGEESYEVLPGVQVTTFRANHPGMTLGFVLDLEGRRVAYCPDNWVDGGDDVALGARIEGAALLIHDARFSASDLASRSDRDHCCLPDAISLSIRHSVRRLVGFHMDGSYDDAALEGIERAAAAMDTGTKFSLQCQLAREGAELLV